MALGIIFYHRQGMITGLVQVDMYFGYKARSMLVKNFKYQVIHMISGLSKAEYEKQEAGWYLSLLEYDIDKAQHYLQSKFIAYQTIISIIILLLALYRMVG